MLTTEWVVGLWTGHGWELPGNPNPYPDRMLRRIYERNLIPYQTGFVEARQPAAVQFVRGVHGDFVGYAGDLITDQILEFGAHTRNEIAFLTSVVRRGDAVIDLGAHIGTFTVPLAAAVGSDGRVIAVEAHRTTYNLLETNVGLNGRSEWVSCLNVAVGARNQRLGSMTVPARNTGAAFYSSGDQNEVWSLSDIMSAASITQLDVLKVDIEGLEFAVLRDSVELLRKFRPVIYFEMSARGLARNGIDPSEVEDLLRSLGYSMYRNVGERNSRSDDFTATEIASFSNAAELFDCLALFDRTRAAWLS